MKLTDTQINERLGQLEGWKYETNTLRSSRTFPDFVTAIAFVNRVADAAESANHHPDLDIRYNKVLIALSSHDVGGITERDFRLAKKISTL